jgi:hypothetical protein
VCLLPIDNALKEGEEGAGGDDEREERKGEDGAGWSKQVDRGHLGPAIKRRGKFREKLKGWEKPRKS